jgi:hypothetical protein
MAEELNKEAEDASAGTDQLGLNPINGLTDIKSLQGTSYFFPATFDVEGKEIFAGMMVRHVTIQDRGGPLTSFNIDVLDLAFMASALSKMMVEDISLLSHMSDYKLLTTDDVRRKFVERITAVRENADRTLELLGRIESFAPSEFSDEPK